MQNFAEIGQIKHVELEKNSEISKKLRIPSGGQKDDEVFAYVAACKMRTALQGSGLNQLVLQTEAKEAAKMKQMKWP